MRTASEWILGAGDVHSYLRRLELANEVFQDDIVLHAVLSDEYGTVSILSSQPHYEGDPASQRFVMEAMRGMGFRPTGRGSAFYREEDNVAVFDLHEENVLRSGDLLVVIDPVLIEPTGRLKDILLRQLAP